MTTYSAITNAEIDQDSPVTEPLMTKLRDNPIAIAEGASGAPKVELDALEIGTTTYTNTIAPAGTITENNPSSQRLLFPNITVTAGVSADLQIDFVAAGVKLTNNGGGNVSYSIVWPFLQNTP